MPTRRRGNTLEKWEVAIIKSMIAAKQPSNDQGILAYFTRPSRSINHRAVAEIQKDLKEIAHVLLKEVDKPRFTSTGVMQLMHKEG